MPRWQKMIIKRMVNKAMKNNLLPIAKEGWRYILYAFTAFIVFAILDLELLELTAFIAIFAFAYIYRNPERILPTFEKASVISPVDGRVIAIEELEDNEYTYKIEIESSYMDVSVLRIPLTSEIESFSIVRGARLPKQNLLSKLLNENATVVFKDHDANRVKVTHMLKRSFDSIKFDLFEKQKVSQGNRYGTVVNGTTTIYLPQNFRLNVGVGSELKGAQTLVGYFS